MDINTPIASIMPSAIARETLSDLVTDLLARSVLQVWLYSNNVNPANTVNLASFTECTFGGYARVNVTSFTTVKQDPVGNAFALTPLVSFDCDGTSSDNVCGAILVGTKTGGVAATATNAGNSGAYAALFTITAGGSGYENAPKVRLTGATGSGATAHAVITAGVVTAIVLDTPGTGYTTYLVVIDPPLEVVQQSQLSTTGINISTSTDSINTNVQLAIPPYLAA